jgi:hypothetical protein
MPVLCKRWKFALVGFLAYAVVAWYFGGDVRGQRKRADEEKPAAAKEKTKAPVTVPKKGMSDATPVYYGVQSCRGAGGCHAEAKPLKFDPKNPIVCQCDELTIWGKRDKHGKAYKVLDTSDKKNEEAERARRMEAILGKDDPNYKVYKDDRCLACHALVIDPKFTKVKSFNIEEGVNCVVCHGAYLEWVRDHQSDVVREASKYRTLSRQEKQKKLGMIDLWDPLTRARVCASCHIGNKEEGKFVTHEMYAAGHPPLPGFEPGAFSNEMPRHWKYLREKPREVIKIQGLNKEGLKSFEFEQSKIVLVGAAVSLAESMALLAAKAKEASAEKDALDLSNFDCYACHHDLKAPSWRQARGYTGKPGRVPMRPWPTELVKLAVHFLGEGAEQQEKELDKSLADLHKAFSAQPFGDPARIEKAATKLSGWANTLAANLNKKPLTEKDAKRLQQLIPKLYVNNPGPDKKPLILDYDSARQVGWAFKAITGELLFDPKDPDNPRKALPEVAKALKALNTELYLDLYHDPGPDKGPQIIEPDLKKRMDTVNAYKPEDFRTILLNLSKVLSRGKD